MNELVEALKEIADEEGQRLTRDSLLVVLKDTPPPPRRLNIVWRNYGQGFNSRVCIHDPITRVMYYMGSLLEAHAWFDAHDYRWEQRLGLYVQRAANVCHGMTSANPLQS